MGSPEARAPLHGAPGTTAPVAVVWVCTSSGEQADHQPAWTEFTGQSADEAHGRGWLQAVHPDDRATAASLFEAASAIQGTSIRVRHHDASYRWLRLHPLVRSASDGSADALIIIGIDVTRLHRADIERQWVIAAAQEARIEAEDEARRAQRSEAKLRAVFSALTEGIVLVNADGIVEEANPSLVHDLGMALPPAGLRSELMSTQLLTASGEPLPEADHPIRVALRDRRSVRDVEVGLVTPEGISWRLLNAEPVRDEQGNVLGVVASYFDVTERKRFEEALRESEQRYRRMFEASPHPMWVLDAESLSITAVNAAAVEQYGYSEEEFRRLLLDDMVHPADLGSMRRALQVAHSGVTDFGVRRHIRKDGTELLAEVTSHVIQVDTRRAVVQLAQDVTERVRIQREMATLNEDLEQRVAERTAEAEQANRAKSQFVATMSHELRTPLNAIIGFADVLKEGMVGSLSDQQQRFVEEICAAGKHLHSLINDVLDLAKVEAGKLELELGECRVADLLEAAALVLREKSLRRGIRFEVSADPAVGTAWLDTRRMKQVLFNLLSNAVKFSPDHSSVRLKAWPCTRNDIRVNDSTPSRLLPLPPGDEREFLAFAVEDGGPGIPADQLGMLFTPFGQVKGVKSHESEGTGLGLSLVSRLVQLQGGTVGVESAVGTGTRFLVWIPRRPTQA